MNANYAYLLLGSNLGNPVKTIGQAVDLLQQKCGIILKHSSLYQTEPWGFVSDDKFVNAVVLLETELTAKALLIMIHDIEKELGRVRHETQYSSRLIDIDILFFNDDIIIDADLEIPHPRMHLRRFTLQPLSEIAGEFIHPALMKTVNQLLLDCVDTKNVEVIL